MDEIKEMENLENEVEETTVDDEITDLLPVEDESEDSIGTGEKVAVGAILALAAVGTAAMVKKCVNKIKERNAKKKEQKESAEIDRLMADHPGFLGKFKKNKTKKSVEVIPGSEKNEDKE